MKISRFEDIESWKHARELVRLVYDALKGCSDRSLKDQIQRASVSVMSNIAEGFERGGNKEFLHFLSISRGSLSEVKSLTYVAVDNGLISREQFATLQQKCQDLSALINGFMRYLKNSSRVR